MVKILVSYNLKPETNQAEYEQYLVSEHNPRMKLVPGAIDSNTLKINTVMQGTFPFQYVAEVTMENEMSVMMASTSPQMQELMKVWTPKVKDVTVAVTKVL